LDTIRIMRQRETERECFLVLWVRLVSKRECIFPCTLGTFSVKERVYLLVLWYDSYNVAERERAFPYTLGMLSIKKSISLYFGYA
jgi:hypothetical protein